MAYSVIATQSRASTNGNGVTTTAINTVGSNFITVAICSYGPVADPTLTDNKSNTWNKLTTYNSGTVKTVLYWTQGANVGTSSHTFTSGGSGNYPTIHIIAFSGGTASPFIGATGKGTTSGSSITSGQPGSVSPTSNDQLFISSVNSHQNLQTSTTAVDTIDSSFTRTTSSAFTSGACFTTAMAYKIQTISNSENPTWTFPSAYQATNNYAANLACFKSDAVSTPVNSGFFFLFL